MRCSPPGSKPKSAGCLILAAATTLILLFIDPQTTAPQRRPTRLLNRVFNDTSQRRQLRRREVTKLDNATLTNLDKATLARPFNLADEVSHRSTCQLRMKNFEVPDIVAIAVARSASDAVVKATTGGDELHIHACTLADWAAAGARRVVVPLRDPVSRLISGFQRRMSSNSTGGWGKVANREFKRSFPSLDKYVDALFDPANPLHAIALKVTYPDHNQHFMMPVEEFYLAPLDRGVPRDGGEVAVDVRYACIESLDDDMVAILGAWGRTPDPKGLKNLKNHSSRFASDKPTTRHRFISERNAARVEALYAADAALHARHCGPDRGREPGGETFRLSPPQHLRKNRTSVKSPQVKKNWKCCLVEGKCCPPVSSGAAP
eukprot:CAMPEP_0185747222 /NCGR_PEP_ID=MMETSP1174-20130828/5837_1 /TAXON_ID=35687 /ORGANISM="Dictyocha speculum, Strain CCMP1381" /LENGTH=375 /DNA_ID=CAMNT_0028422289 /DNA_START=196 /DNA_END=1323 /DNA_ORIENTATION=+